MLPVHLRSAAVPRLPPRPPPTRPSLPNADSSPPYGLSSPDENANCPERIYVRISYNSKLHTMVKNRRPDKDEGCCSVHFLKYVLFIFNFLFYFAGLTVLGLGIWSLFYKTDYVSLLTSNTYVVTVYLFIAAGVLVLLLGVLGCVGLFKENRSCLLLFTFSLLLIFAVEAIAGVLAYVYCEQVDHELKQSFQQTLKERYGEDKAVTKAANRLHEEHGCCGADVFQDWRNSSWFKTVNSELEAKKRDGKIQQVPDVCCRSIKPGCGRRDHPSNIYYEGCLPVLKREIQEQEVILGAVALGISAIEIFGMFISCCLYVKLKDFDDKKQGSIRRPLNSYY